MELTYINNPIIIFKVSTTSMVNTETIIKNNPILTVECSNFPEKNMQSNLISHYMIRIFKKRQIFQ